MYKYTKMSAFSPFRPSVVYILSGKMIVCGTRALEPRSDLAFDDGDGVGAAHDSQDVGKVRQGGGFVLPRLPQAQYGIRRALLDGEVVQVPVGRQFLGEHPPVVSARTRRVEAFADVLLHGAAKSVDGQWSGVTKSGT